MAQEPKRYQFAIVKFNGGLGALLCNTCRTIIATGRDHEDRIHTCTQCQDGTRLPANKDHR